MKTSTRLIPLLLLATLPLAACKKSPPAPEAANADASAAQAAATADTSNPANTPSVEAPAAQAAGAGAEPAPAPPFDFNTVAEVKGKIPPFPYVDYPEGLGESFRWTRSVPMDRVFVILGRHLHPVEGRVTMRTFSNRDADMSELEVRRNYDNALRQLGAVKVNTVAPEDPALVAANGDEYVMRNKKLLIPDRRMSYDVYLARQGSARHWIVLMINERETRLLAIEEKPFTQTVGYVGAGDAARVTASGAPAAAPQPLDIQALPVNTAPLPPFPYLDYPPGLHPGFQETGSAKFDATHIIVGNALRVVEGRVETRTFAYRHADMSQMAARRNYEAAVKGLGAIRVNTVAPEDPALMQANTSAEVNEHRLREGKMRIPDRNMSYDSYLLRTPRANVWLVLMFGESEGRLLVVEEKAMTQSVALVTADTMRKELADKGKIALYINFDTDKASIRSDGQPTVDEIARLMKSDPALKLAIEGHTDDSGNAARNLALSRERAEAVVQSLRKEGIDAGRLRAAGHGATRPLADNKDEAGRALNRRVELVRS